MNPAADSPQLSLLQRVDLAMASRLASETVHIGDLTAGGGLPTLAPTTCQNWVSGVLGLRGLLVSPDDVDAVLDGNPIRMQGSKEMPLVQGMIRVYERIVEWGNQGRRPDGWLMVELFKVLTTGVARFRNNHVRRDLPWDAILYVNYPAGEDLPDRLDGFSEANSYGDHPLRFSKLHPVRRAFRVLWRFGRIAPFPDFNLTMAWVAMGLYLRHAGYPMLEAQRQDRERLHRLISGQVPTRVVSFESRLLESLEA